MRPDPQSAARQAIVDEYGEVDRKVKLWTPTVNPHLQRRAELQAVIESWYEDYAPGLGGIQQGKQYQVEVSPQQWQQSLTAETQAKAFALIKRAKLIDPFTIFTTTLAALKSHLGQAFLDSHVPRNRTGRRTITVVAKAEPVLAKVA